jgi:hypothetical protein
VTKTNLITPLLRQSQLGHRDVALAVGILLDHTSQTLAIGLPKTMWCARRSPTTATASSRCPW